MSFVESIITKRDGGVLSRDQIAEFVTGATRGTLPPEQLAAMLMAIFWRGMESEETRWLTEAMLRSGEQWSLAEERPDAVDKHSTGGVGDTVSLVLAPMLAAAGVPVAMMAGRGLGHSQGTVDKLLAIPGFRCDWSRDGVLSLLDECGVAMVAQSERVAPADRVLYALRDVTGTVPSLPLITSSIMSKKLAMGAGTLVLDVKWGRGAFRSTIAEARELAAVLRGVGREMGVATQALVTDMNQPLGPALGTACEVLAARDVLAGRGGGALRILSVRLVEAALTLRGWSGEAAQAKAVGVLEDGSALAAWERAVEAHGGDPDPARLPQPIQRREIPAKRAGWVQGVAATDLGWVAVEIGAGRRTRDEELAYGAGLLVHVRIGDRVEAGQPVATLLVGERPVDEDRLAERVQTAFEVGSEPVPEPTLIVGTVDEIPAH